MPLRIVRQAVLAALFAALTAPSAQAQERVSLERLRQQVSENPQDVKLRVALGDALDDAGDGTAAIVQYREAIRLDPQFAPAYRNLALAHIRRMEWAAAETAARDAIRIDPNYVLAHCDLAVILANRDEAEASSRAWQQALNINRGEALAYMRLGRSALEQLECERAKPEALAQLLVGLALRAARDNERAIREVQRATQLDPQFALAYYILGEFWAASGRTAEASKARAAAAGINPLILGLDEGKPRAIRETSPLGASQARKAELASFHDMIPNLGRIRRLSDSTLEQKQKAMQLLQSVALRLNAYLKESPDDAEMHLLFGESLRELGETQRATRAYRGAVAKAGEERRDVAAQAWRMLGHMEFQAGREREALDLFAQGLRAQPGDAALLNDSAWIYATSKDKKIRDPQLALGWAQRAVEATREKSPYCLRTLAEAQFAMGQTSEAVKSLRRAIELAPAEEEYKSRLREMQSVPSKR